MDIDFFSIWMYDKIPTFSLYSLPCIYDFCIITNLHKSIQININCNVSKAGIYKRTKFRYLYNYI